MDEFGKAVTRAFSTKVTGTLHPIKRGSGQDTYALVRAQLRSVGHPNWEERVHRSDLEKPKTTSAIFCFGTDAVPDNVGMSARVRRSLDPSTNIMCVWMFCLFHKGHLISDIESFAGSLGQIHVAR